MLTENRSAILRVLVEGRVHFEVKIVDQPHESPKILIGVEDTGILAHARLDAEAMP
jgi:hypothetical protein